MFPDRIETGRLMLEPLSRDTVDVLALHEHLGAHREGVHEELRYLPWGPFETPHATHEWVRDAERRWEDRTRATYVLRAGEAMAEAGELVGITYLDLFWERRSGEMVMWSRRPFWGRGLMVEYGKAIFDLAFCDLGVEVMLAEAVEGNDHGREIFEHMTEAFDGQYDGRLRNRVPMDGAVKDVHRFSITRA